MRKNIQEEGTRSAKALRWSETYMIQEQQGGECVWSGGGGRGDEICAANQLQSLGISDSRQCFLQHSPWNVSAELTGPLGLLPLAVPLSALPLLPLLKSRFPPHL